MTHSIITHLTLCGILLASIFQPDNILCSAKSTQVLIPRKDEAPDDLSTHLLLRHQDDRATITNGPDSIGPSASSQKLHHSIYEAVSSFLGGSFFGGAPSKTSAHANEDLVGPLTIQVETRAARKLALEKAVAIRLNAGGSAFTDAAGNAWEPDDAYANTGRVYKTGAEIIGTPDQELYQTERWDPRYGESLQYFFTDLPNGKYDVKLHFSENYVDEANERIFHVSMQNTGVFANIDIFAEAGAKFKPLVKTANVVVDDGTLFIEFKGNTENPKINGIEILSNCVRRTIDFSRDATGNELLAGPYVSREWEEYGMLLSASGGYGEHPRLFNTSDPGPDSDLGAPNERCSPPGPGKGEGGEPDMTGKNCKPRGNALIIQEDNRDPSVPDDNANGGTFNIHFPELADVYEIGLLDIDYASSITLILKNSGKGYRKSRPINVPLLGDNSYQVVEINKEKVKRVYLDLSRSGAITSISFCGKPGGAAIPPTQKPTVPPTQEPSTLPPSGCTTELEQVGEDIVGKEELEGFGYSIATSFNGTVIASVFDRYSQNTVGGVRVYRWNGDTWKQMGKDIVGQYSSQSFAHSIALSHDGTVLAVGAPVRGGLLPFVKVFQWKGNAWTQLGNDILGNKNDFLGSAVSLSGNGSIVAVGAPQMPYAHHGLGYVRVLNWDGKTWNKVGDDILGEAFWDQSGQSVSLSNNGQVVSIGSPENMGGTGDFGSRPAGHVRVFVWSGKSWIQRGEDIEPGYAVSMSGDGTIVAVGKFEGFAQVWKWNGAAWERRGNELAGGHPNYGSSQLSMSNDGREVVVAGSINRLFYWEGSEWTLRKSFDFRPSSAAHAGVVGTVAISDWSIGHDANDPNPAPGGRVLVYSCDAT